eukprot:1176199-Prorocentrum_minimum.AAC.2
MEGEGRTPIHVYVGFALSLVGMLCAGTLYAYGAYEDSLKVALDFTQSQVETVGIFGDAGSLLSGPFVGMFVDRFGPCISCLVAGFNLYLGYLLMYAFVVRKIENSVLMAVFFALVGNGSALLYLSLLTTQVKKFSPRYRGMVIGFLVSMYGLSALFFITGYATLFAGKRPVSTFLLFVGTFTGTVAMMSSGWAFVSHRVFTLSKEPSKYEQLSEEEGEVDESSGCETTPNRCHPPETLNEAAIDVDKQALGTAATEGQLEEKQSSSTRCTFETDASLSKEPVAASSWNRLARDRNFWFSFVFFFLLAGAGLTFINNTSSIAKAVQQEGASLAEKGKLVMTFSFMNCMGSIPQGHPAHPAQDGNIILDTI